MSTNTSGTAIETRGLVGLESEDALLWAASSCLPGGRAQTADDALSVRLVNARELSAEDVSVWSDIQQQNPAVDSPFFRPEFTQVVASVRDEVEVAILQSDGRPVGFFPFHRTRHGVAQAVGRRLSDLHGVIVAEQTTWSPEKLIDGCGLRAWYFDHLIQSQSPLRPYHWRLLESPYLDLRAGFAAYAEDLRSRGSRQLSQVLRKARKLAREVGRLRLEFHSGESIAFESLRKWKAEQYRRTRRLDVFQYDWVSELLDRIRRTQSEGFQGVLSVLHAGDQIAALHLGVRSRHVLHWWFPTYNQDLAQYSPGLILLTELAKASQSLGIQRIDLGRGDERYKASVSNGAFLIAEGAVDRRLVSRTIWRTWHACKQGARRSRCRPVLEVPLNLSRRFREWAMFG